MKFTEAQIKEMENAQAHYAECNNQHLLILVLPAGAYSKTFAPAIKDRDEVVNNDWMKILKNQL